MWALAEDLHEILNITVWQQIIPGDHHQEMILMCGICGTPNSGTQQLKFSSMSLRLELCIHPLCFVFARVVLNTPDPQINWRRLMEPGLVWGLQFATYPIVQTGLSLVMGKYCLFCDFSNPSMGLTKLFDMPLVFAVTLQSEISYHPLLTYQASRIQTMQKVTVLACFALMNNVRHVICIVFMFMLIISTDNVFEEKSSLALWSFWLYLVVK